MDFRKVTDELAVAPQIKPADVAAAKAAGFRSIICNRPDGEEPSQTPFRDIAAAAEAAGIEIRHQPVRAVGANDAAQFAAIMAELPKPVLAYCRSGTRCVTLWTIGAIRDMDADEVVQHAKSAGYDMSNVVANLRR